MQIYKRSNGIYYLKYNDEFGNEKRTTTKCKKKVDAIKFLANFKSKDKNQQKPKSIKLFKAAEQYLLYLRVNHSKSYWENVDVTLRLFKESVGDKKLHSIIKTDIEVLINQKIQDDKLYIAHQLLRNLKIFFNWAIESGFIEKSPATKIKALRLPEKKPTWITYEQFCSILGHVTDNRLKDIYTILFYTGMRANELLSLTWENINLDDKILHIRNSKSFTTKSGKERSIPMNDSVFNITQRQTTRFDGGLLFKKNGVKYNVDYISKQFKKAIRECGLDESIHLHSLRHSFASNLVKNGISLYQVSSLLGHSKIATTQIYAHLEPNDLRDAVNLL